MKQSSAYHLEQNTHRGENILDPRTARQPMKLYHKRLSVIFPEQRTWICLKSCMSLSQKRVSILTLK